MPAVAGLAAFDEASAEPDALVESPDFFASCLSDFEAAPSDVPPAFDSAGSDGPFRSCLA